MRPWDAKDVYGYVRGMQGYRRDDCNVKERRKGEEETRRDEVVKDEGWRMKMVSRDRVRETETGSVEPRRTATPKATHTHRRTRATGKKKGNGGEADSSETNRASARERDLTSLAQGHHAAASPSSLKLGGLHLHTTEGISDDQVLDTSHKGAIQDGPPSGRTNRQSG